MNNEILKEVSAKVSSANNVLVAVSSNPSVDELSAAVGLTLFLNKLGKHATTVFSGVVPSTLEFLQPEQAIEKTTDSLRDFIIALDKSKADKLRYKVEDDVVRIFITPYKTTITDSDLQFSLGEFNVDVVISVGISKREDVDQAVTAHGRILHDATVVALTNKENSDFGAINWNEPQSSSVSEMIAAVAYQISNEKIDGQMATALLTGIIAETDRFRNERTTPLSLDFASRLMRAGANQQLIADELEAAVKLQEAPAMEMAEELPEPHESYVVPQPLDHKEDDGSLQIEHQEEGHADPSIENIEIDHRGNLTYSESAQEVEQKKEEHNPPAENTSTYLQEEPHKEEARFDVEDDHQEQKHTEGHDQPIMTHGKTITPLHESEYAIDANKPFDAQKAFEAMAQDQGTGPQVTTGSIDAMPEATQPEVSAPAPVFEPEVSAPPVRVHHEQTLEDLEKAVNSPHIAEQSTSETSAPHEDSAEPEAQPSQPIDMSSIPQPLTEDDQNNDAPPPVPPPMQPQFFDNNGGGQ